MARTSLKYVVGYDYIYNIGDSERKKRVISSTRMQVLTHAAISFATVMTPHTFIST